MSSSSLRNVVVFGAGGSNIGFHIVRELLSNAFFNVSIIARQSSISKFPPAAKVMYIADEMPYADLVEALKGKDAVVSAIGFGSLEVERKLIDAAVEAKVKRFIPSEYGVNNTDPRARALCPVFDAKGKMIEYLKEKEVNGMTWTAIPTGLWLEWALQPAISFLDINIANHTASLWDDGKHALSFTTLSWAAKGVVEILLHEADTVNKVVPIRAFEASQVDIVTALEGVQGVKYEISKIASEVKITEAKAKWEGEKNGDAALTLVKAGFFLDGYGSNFMTEGTVPVGNDFLDLTQLSLQSVIEQAVKL